MQIFADKFQLADNGEIESIDFNGERQLQIDDGPRWEEIQVRDRLNEKNTITFVVNRGHESLVACERYCILHSRLVPRIAAVFRMICNAGGPRVELKIRNAGIATVSSKYIGSLSTHQYQVIGGRIQ
jgi:hypothetical protein